MQSQYSGDVLYPGKTGSSSCSTSVPLLSTIRGLRVLPPVQPFQRAAGDLVHDACEALTPPTRSHLQGTAYSGPAPPTADPFQLDWGDEDDMLKPSKLDSTQYASPASSPGPNHWRVNMIAGEQPAPETPDSDPRRVVRTLGFEPSPAGTEDSLPRGWRAGASDVEGFSPYAPAHSARSSGRSSRRSSGRGDSVGWAERSPGSDGGAAESPDLWRGSGGGAASRWLPGRQP